MGRAAALALFLAALGGGPLPGQEGGACGRPVTLSGQVTSEAGAPLADAAVSIPALQRRLVTDATGRFVLADVCPGRYRIRLSLLGHAAVDREFVVEDGEPLTVTLRNQAVELEGMRVEVAPVMIRLEDRRMSHAGPSAVFDWRAFEEAEAPANIPEWVAARAGVRIVACGDAYWGVRNCYRDRRGVRPVRVCVDETRSVASPAVLARFPREEIGRAEFYRREGLMKIYTKEFLARAAFNPWMIRPSAAAC